MSPSDEFMTIAELELRFVQDLIERIGDGSLVPVGLDRDRSVALLMEVAAGRKRLIERLQPYAADGGTAWGGAPV